MNILKLLEYTESSNEAFLIFCFDDKRKADEFFWCRFGSNELSFTMIYQMLIIFATYCTVQLQFTVNSSTSCFKCLWEQ